MVFSIFVRFLRRLISFFFLFTFSHLFFLFSTFYIDIFEYLRSESIFSARIPDRAETRHGSETFAVCGCGEITLKFAKTDVIVHNCGKLVQWRPFGGCS